MPQFVCFSEQNIFVLVPNIILFVGLVVYVQFSIGEVEDSIKCGMIGLGSSRYIDSFSNLFIAAVHYTLINTCYVLLLLFTAPMHTTMSMKK